MNLFLPYLHLRPRGGVYISLGVQSRKWARLSRSVLPFVLDNLTMKSSHALLWMLQLECEVSPNVSRIWTLSSQQLVMGRTFWDLEP